MRTTGKQPIKPTPSPGPAILPIEADPPEGDQERDEESVSDTRTYHLGTKIFRKATVVENGESDAAPEEAREVRESHQDEVHEHKQDQKVSPKPRVKTQRPSKVK
jgi:hypothetical protein